MSDDGRMGSRVASCSCGQLRIELLGELDVVVVCHCHACQKRTGSVFATIASFDGPYRVTGEAAEHVRTGDAGTQLVFRFCPSCGTNLFHTEVGEEDGVGVAVGAFADPAFPKPSISTYTCRRHAWVRLPPGTTTFEKDPT